MAPIQPGVVILGGQVEGVLEAVAARVALVVVVREVLRERVIGMNLSPLAAVIDAHGQRAVKRARRGLAHADLSQAAQRALRAATQPEERALRGIVRTDPRRGHVDIAVALEVHGIDVGEVARYGETAEQLMFNAGVPLVSLRILEVTRN